MQTKKYILTVHSKSLFTEISLYVVRGLLPSGGPGII